MQKITPDKKIKKELKIASVTFDSCVVLAPMAGVTNTVFRQMLRTFSNKGLFLTEMISAEALRMNKKHEIIDFSPLEHPLAFQISGHRPKVMAEAAKRLEESSVLIDINMGCPVPKIVRNNDGSKLMTDLKAASEIIREVKNSVQIPVTVKCRLGWDNNSRNYLEFAKMAEESGADAITVHGRTRSQMYSGEADWDAIGEIKNILKIPVIGNGDINSPEKALECIVKSGCDAIAVGRGILGNPDLLHRIETYFETGKLPEAISIRERLDFALKHLEKEIYYRGEQRAIKFMRKFIAWYLKGIKNVSKYRANFMKCDEISQIYALFDEIKNMS